MTYTEAKLKRDALEAECKACAALLNSFPKGAMNLTPDTVKATPEWKQAKAASENAFARLRTFNAGFVKHYAAELLADRRIRRVA